MALTAENPAAPDSAEMRNGDFLANLVGSAPFGIYVVDSNFRLISVNDGASAVFAGIDPLIGRDFDEVLRIVWPEEFVSEALGHFRRTLSTGQAFDAPTITWERNNIAKVESYDWKLRRIRLPDGSYCVVCYFYDLTEHKELETALFASDKRFKLAQRAGRVGVWDWDLRSGRMFWSEMMWELYGEPPSENDRVEIYWSERLHPEDRGRVLEALQHAIGSADVEYSDTFRIITKNKEVRWLENTATIARDTANEPVRIYGVCLDITDKVAIEERVRLSEHQLRLITDNIPALVAYIDADERYRFVNARYTEWFGMPYSEIVGKKVRDVVGIKAHKQLKPNLQKVLSGEQVVFELEITYKTAGARFVNISYMPDLASDGTVLGFYALISNQTDIKRSEQLLRFTEDRIRILTESFTDYAIFSMDTEGIIDSWNPGGENVYGYLDSEIIGRSVEILFTPEDVEREIQLTEMRQARKYGRASDDRWHIKKDGSRFFANGVMAPLYIGTTHVGYAKIVSDRSDKKRATEILQLAHDEMEARVLVRTRELAESNERLIGEIGERKTAEGKRIDMLHRMISGQEEERRRIALDIHDHLGQRLTALRLKIASLIEACGDNEDLCARATRLQQIAEMIDSDVSFLAWELRPTALDELGLTDAIGTFVKEWSRHYAIPADFHPAGVSRVRLDREAETHLYRITQEALNNIVKHARAKNVNVVLEKHKDTIILIIEDDGSGFTLKHLTTRLDSRRGLGLKGMAERAELMSGTLEIESAAGRGTTIYARVPIVATEKG